MAVQSSEAAGDQCKPARGSLISGRLQAVMPSKTT